MGFKTELHCHTGEVSSCADVMSDLTVQAYIDAGYTSLTVTNHLNRFTFGEKNSNKYVSQSPEWKDKLDFFFGGVEIAKKCATGRINILWGSEIRFNCDKSNDYLVYGLSEEFLYSHPDLLDMNLKTAGPLIRENGGLIFQAHPFRVGMVMQKPSLLDGIEAYNGHTNHDSKNDIAYMWAKKFGLPMISGTDRHHVYQLPTGGIETDEPLTNNDELIEALKSGNYTPILAGQHPEGGKHDTWK